MGTLHNAPWRSSCQSRAPEPVLRSAASAGPPPPSPRGDPLEGGGASLQPAAALARTEVTQRADQRRQRRLKFPPCAAVISTDCVDKSGISQSASTPNVEGCATSSLQRGLRSASNTFVIYIGVEFIQLTQAIYSNRGDAASISDLCFHTVPFQDSISACCQPGRESTLLPSAGQATGIDAETVTYS